ncbi:hypothetical protein LAD64_27545 [Klebsiella pneumoniae]|nr:hypothetical protein [Klebsiella pneumoniae]
MQQLVNQAMAAILQDSINRRLAAKAVSPKGGGNPYTGILQPRRPANAIQGGIGKTRRPILSAAW